MRRCTICQQIILQAKSGPRRKRCKGCAKAWKQQYNTAYVSARRKGEPPGRPKQQPRYMRRVVEGVLVEHDDLPTAVLEQMLAQNALAVKGQFTVDPWAQRIQVEYE